MRIGGRPEHPRVRVEGPFSENGAHRQYLRLEDGPLGLWCADIAVDRYGLIPPSSVNHERGKLGMSLEWLPG